MATSHAEQRRKGIALSLEAAGIGRAYHSRSLTEIGKAARLADWVSSGQAKTEVRAGKGKTFVGADSDAYDAAILTARALHLTGVSSFVVPLRRLVKWLEVKSGDVEGLDQARQAEALFVMDFVQTYDKGECPLAGWQIQDVEVFLGDRIDNQKAVFLHVAKPLTKAGWWSGNLVKRVARANEEMEVSP